MAAGLPGFGLSGVFFVVSALLMVPIEVVSTLRGRSSLARWGDVLRNAGTALALVAGVELTYVALHFAVTQLSASATGPHGTSAHAVGRTVSVVHAIPVLPILGTLGLVVIVVASAKVAQIVSGLRRRPIGPQSGPAHVQPLAVDHERVGHELQPRLALASGESR